MYFAVGILNKYTYRKSSVNVVIYGFETETFNLAFFVCLAENLKKQIKYVKDRITFRGFLLCSPSIVLKVYNEIKKDTNVIYFEPWKIGEITKKDKCNCEFGVEISKSEITEKIYYRIDLCDFIFPHAELIKIREGKYLLRKSLNWKVEFSLDDLISFRFKNCEELRRKINKIF